MAPLYSSRALFDSSTSRAWTFIAAPSNPTSCMYSLNDERFLVVAQRKSRLIHPEHAVRQARVHDELECGLKLGTTRALRYMPEHELVVLPAQMCGNRTERQPHTFYVDS